VTTCIALLAALSTQHSALSKDLKTTAERTNYAETSRNADVLAFCDALNKAVPGVGFSTFGTSGDGQPLPLLTLTRPPHDAATDRPAVLVFANIHAGEVDGKEAVLALARDLARDKSPLLDALRILIVPNLNPDGNDRFGRHRPDQNGPDLVGTRENAAGRDLNRDFVKLDTPEVRALVKLVNTWKPVAAVDCHTTNGSAHRYALTHDGPRHPAAGPALISLARDAILPDVAMRMRAATGFDCFPYGNFNRGRDRWETYPAQPRYGVQYLAARGVLALLSESYTHAPFADRVRATYAFVKGTLESVAAHADRLTKLPPADGPVPLRTRTVPAGTATVRGFVAKGAGQKPAADDAPQDYPVQLVTAVEPTLTVNLPAAYYVPPGFPQIVQTLQRHGLPVSELHEDVEVTADAYTVAAVKRSDRPYQGRSLLTIEAEARPTTELVRAGGVVVPTAGPLGRLAGLLLEPQSEDGLAAWDGFGPAVAEGNRFPVLRLPGVPVAKAGRPAPLPEDRPKPKPITLGTSISPGGFGGPTEWLDADRYLTGRGDAMKAVDARTGKSSAWLDPAKLKASLAGLGLSDATVGSALRSVGSRMLADRSASLVEAGGEYLLVRHDGTPATKFGKTGGGREVVSVNPAGTHLAYVKDGDLYRVDGTTGATVRLTEDGGKDVLNGLADWVYEEELYGRGNRKLYWWGPGGALAFLRLDDGPVYKFSLTKWTPARGDLETYAYPKPGDPNPLVQLGVAPPGKPVAWLSLAGYPAADTLISRVGWRPDGVPFAYVQNRTQTWLDVCVWPDRAGPPVRLFRETTKAWVEDLGEPRWLPGGDFLILSERSGWKHLYRYTAAGELANPVTAGDWEVRGVERVDADAVYVSAGKDSPTGSHLYRATLDGTGLERITPAGGTHRVTLAPSGPLYLDRFADEDTPTRVAVRSGPDVVRTLDSNPLPERDGYVWGRYERVKIPTPDGFVLEGTVTYPPDFDAKKRYPVWVRTYAGPHAPTVRDGWQPRIFQQVLAASGIVAFDVDPRSGSGKGAVSAWACYKQMGVSELRDLETAVDWLTAKPWADPARVGLSGHSYGGFMTAFALTHSKTFAAGISGAPVLDWRLYDSIYTERYMGLPSENKDGYDKTSVVKAAGNLHGRLLLVHGLMDDNVHFQNSAQFIEALHRAGKTFDLMVYPQSRHGLPSAGYQKLQLDFIKRTMGVP
jgi:dipeptidyl aminopeptidase/acylaminoacyl peptidase